MTKILAMRLSSLEQPFLGGLTFLTCTRVSQGFPPCRKKVAQFCNFRWGNPMKEVERISKLCPLPPEWGVTDKADWGVRAD
jgi:hypothetical protein